MFVHIRLLIGANELSIQVACWFDIQKYILKFFPILTIKLSGNQAKKVFSQSATLQNPLTGLMIGVIVTLLVQSSSTSSSIVINMVAADVLSVKMAIPVIMGANIGIDLALNKFIITNYKQ